MRYIWQHADWSNFTWQSDQLLDAVSKARFSQGKLLSKIVFILPTLTSISSSSFPPLTSKLL